MKAIRIIATYFLVFCLSLGTLGLILFHVFQRDLSNIVLSTLEPYLQADVKVKSLQATLFNSFPKGSVELVDVRISDTDTNSVENAYEIGRVYLLFDYKDLFSGNIRVRHIIIRDAVINMIYLADGTTNFEFWKAKDSNGKDTSQFELALDKVEIYNTRFSIFNQLDGFKLQTQIHNAEFSLKTLAGTTHMDIMANFDINNLSDGELQWIKDKHLKSQLGFSIKDLDKYTIQDGDLTVEGMKFKIDGVIDNSGESLFTDIEIKSEYSRLEELLGLLPSLLVGSLDDYKINGAAYFMADIKGNWSATKSANFNIGFGFRDGSIIQNSSGLELTELNLDGRYSNGKNNNNNTSYIHLKGLRAKHNTGEISGDFYLENFSNPFCKFNLKADLDLAWLNDMFHIENLEKIEGEVIADVLFEGLLSNLDQIEKLKDVRVEGDVELKNIHLKSKSLVLPVKNINGQLSFQKPFLMVDDFRFELGASNLVLNGYFKNPLTFFSENQLLLYGDLVCDTILIEQFLAKDISDEETPKSSKDGSFSFDYIFANLNAEIQHLSYEKFELNQVKGNVRFYQKQLFFNDVAFETLDGKVAVTGLAKANSFTGFTVDADIDLQNIDITQLFQVFENFEQTALTAEQIKGNISANTSVSFRMDDKYNVDVSSILVDAPTKVVNGELINFLPMLKLAGFIKVGHFEHIVFDTLESHLFIQNTILHIPQTQVNSNTFDMRISGTHSFDNVVDYKVALNLKKLFMEKNAITDKTFNFYAKAQSGGITVYLLIKGPIANPIISYDMGALGGKIGEGIKNQSETLKKAREQERKLKEMRSDSLLQIHRKNQKIRRRNSIKEGWEELLKK